MSSDLNEQDVIFSPDDVYVIVTPRGEEVHITKRLALTVQLTLLGSSMRNPITGEDFRLLVWLDEHAIRPYLGDDLTASESAITHLIAEAAERG